MSTENINIRFICCQCDYDMTDAVYRECQIERTHPTLRRNASTVMLQCPNGHWCEYLCPGILREGGRMIKVVQE